MLRIKSQKVIEIFFVLDFDRTLGNTDLLFDIFQSVTETNTSFSVNQLAAGRREVESKGESFDVIDYVKSELSSDNKSSVWHGIEGLFIKSSNQADCMMPGAQELLAILDETHKSYGILTYGGEQWQTLKIKATGLTYVPMLVTDSYAKGKLISTWRQPDGTFQIPDSLSKGQGLIAKKIVLIDDKKQNFDHLPANCTGFYIVGKTTYTDNKFSKPPKGVIEVENLLEVISLLDHDIDKA
ncbi:MAG: hypothetical protein ABIQ04_02290 [Candidatus Saccharimonadales bacterium]